MIQKEKIDGYSVIGYDKDNDVFICYGKYEVLANAVEKAKELAKQIESGELKRQSSGFSFYKIRARKPTVLTVG